jgi:hypothetical protein
MADHAEDLRQANLAKLPLFNGDNTDIFTCKHKTPGATSLPVMPAVDNNNADSVETEAELIAALAEAEKSQVCKIADLKAKINRFCHNNQSSRPPNPGPSASAPRPPKKAPNPIAKNF